MARRLFLHVGMMKTGTTYLQAVCNALVDQLAEQGVRVGLGSTHMQIRAFQRLRESIREMPAAQDFWKKLCEEVNATDDDVLLSHELIPRMGRVAIDRLTNELRYDELIVIVTVRDLSRVVPGRWTSTVRNRSTRTWESWLEAVTGDDLDDTDFVDFWLQTDAAAALRHWQERAEPDRVVVVTVPRSDAPRDLLWQRFASVIGVEGDTADDVTIRDNSSLGWASAELLRRLNEQTDDRTWAEYRLGLKSLLGNGAMARRAHLEQRYVLPEAKYDWVQQRSQRMIDELRATGAEVIGDLDELVPQPSTSGITDAHAQPDDSELLEAALWSLDEVAARVAELRQERRRLAVQVRRQQRRLRRLRAQLPADAEDSGGPDPDGWTVARTQRPGGEPDAPGQAPVPPETPSRTRVHEPPAPEPEAAVEGPDADPAPYRESLLRRVRRPGR